MTMSRTMAASGVLQAIVTGIVILVSCSLFPDTMHASGGLTVSGRAVQPQGVKKKLPHTADENSCLLCHADKPVKQASQHGPPDMAMQSSCNRCHATLEKDHYQGSDPFPDADIRKEAIASGILPDSGSPACTSCHDPHGKKDGKGILRAEYLLFCDQSRSIDPHWNDLHCQSCHERQPAKGDAPLQENGDAIALCNRCHATPYARADIHPVGIKPSSAVRIPAGMPLEDGKLTCLTCHDPFCQIGRIKKGKKFETNVVFLRGKQKTRSSFCFLCHVGENYKRLNLHENQIDGQGQIQKETCLFCHSSVPDRQAMGMERVGFVVKNPNDTCIGCHHGFTKTHPAGIDHLKVPSKTVLAAMNTSVKRIGVALPLFRGKIVCTTCHNPHHAGVIEFAAAATGTQREHKLRLMPGIMQCIGCHWDKR